MTVGTVTAEAEVIDGSDDLLAVRHPAGLNVIAAGKCREGGDCEEEYSPDCQPPDYHCKKCGRYMRAA